MSPTHFHDHHAKMNNNSNNNNNGICQPPLRINKGSHVIKKSSSSSSSSSSMMLSPPSSSSSSSASSLGVAGPNKQLQRHPVIIYTHSPKIIHTHPKDFMALVQKLTGCSRSEDDQAVQIKQEKGNPMPETETKGVKSVVGSEDNESSSVITTDENCGSIGDAQVNSCFVPPKFDSPNPYVATIPLFTPNSADFLCPDQPFYNYTDPLFFTPNIRGSSSLSSSSSALEGMNNIREY